MLNRLIHSTHHYLSIPRHSYLKTKTRAALTSTFGRNLQTWSSSSRPVIASPLAFTFDIDGVLLRGEHVLPAAKRALNILDGHNVFGVKIPYILMTNGGGVSEQDRCQKLSTQLGYPIHPNQYIQAHTILKSVVHKYADEPVLVLGGRPGVCRTVAQEYGFKKAYTPLDVLAWNPSVWPFHDLDEVERSSVLPTDFSKTPIRAILVFHDPRNWSLDIQVMLDIIRSRGIVGGPYLAHPGQFEEKEGLKPVDVIFCNPDLIWKSDFERPRLGQGAFRDAFQAVYKSLTGSVYPHIQYGKPTKLTYQFAQQVLHERLRELSGKDEPQSPSIYMVGDNPESDIAGANAAGWSSILVRTGVYDPSEGPPTHTPTVEAADVEEAVTWAIEREAQRVKLQA